jgi:hypothetical protein
MDRERVIHRTVGNLNIGDNDSMEEKWGTNACQPERLG